MTQSIQAVYEQGVFKPTRHLRLKEHTKVSLQIVVMEQWRKAVERLIAQVQTRTAKFTAAEIEADITKASQEVRRLRRSAARPR